MATNLGTKVSGVRHLVARLPGAVFRHLLYPPLWRGMKQANLAVDRRKHELLVRRGEAEFLVSGVARDFTISPSQGGGWCPEEHRRLIGSHRSPARFTLVLRNARLTGSAPVVISESGRLVLESIDRHLEMVKGQADPAAVSACLATTARRLFGRSDCGRAVIADPALLLTGSQAWGYGHFLLDYAPKLISAEDFERRSGRRPRVVLLAKRPKFQNEVLKLLGWSESDVLDWSGDAGVRFHTLIVSSHSRRDRRQMYGSNPADYEWLRERLIPASRGAWRGEKPTRIFVCRRRVRVRRLLNEDELGLSLEPLGFLPVDPGDYSVAEQIDLFQSAEAVVGTQGTGLVNIAFGDGVKLVEILARENPMALHYILANQMGFPYAAVPAETAAWQGHVSVHNRDLQVEIGGVLSALADLGVR